MKEYENIKNSIDEIKRHRKEFKERMDEEDVGYCRRIQDMQESYGQIGEGNLRLRIMLDESIQTISFQRQRTLARGEEYLSTLDREIHVLERKAEESRQYESKDPQKDNQNKIKESAYS